MGEICGPARILTLVLRQALQAELQKCATCKSSGRSLASRKISFPRFLVPFNNHVQIDFLSVSEKGNLPILRMVDLYSAFSVTAMLGSRELRKLKFLSSIIGSIFMAQQLLYQETLSLTKDSLGTSFKLIRSGLRAAQRDITTRLEWLSLRNISYDS